MLIYLLFIFPAFLASLISARTTKITLFWIWFFMSILMWLIVPLGSVDFKSYLMDFETIHPITFKDYFIKDPLFFIISTFFWKLGLPATLFLIGFASFALGIKLIAINKLSNNSAYALLLYSSSFFFLHEFTQVRVALAIGIWMLGLSYLSSNNFKYFGMTFLASLFHYEAAIAFLIPLIIYIFEKKYMRLFFSGLIISILFLSFIGTLDQFSDVLRLVPGPRTEMYFEMREKGLLLPSKQFNFVELLALVTATLVLWKNRKESTQFWRKNAEITFAVCLLVGTLCFTIFNSFSIAAFRFSEFFFSLLPIFISLLINHFESKLFKLGIATTLSTIFIYIFVFRTSHLIDPMLEDLNSVSLTLWFVFMVLTCPFGLINSFKPYQNRKLDA